MLYAMAVHGSQFRVFNLNCYGLKYLSPKRSNRIREIGEYVKSTNFDVVCLQELWVNHDYQQLKRQLKDLLPYSHWFANCSLVGSSGLAIFSRWPLKATLFYQFRLQGCPFKVYHGDWYAKKGVAYARVVMRPSGHTLHIFNSHLHAKYATDESPFSQYAVHRLLQAYEVANFINSIYNAYIDDDHILLVTGDYNTTQKELPYQYLVNKLKLFDCHPCDRYFKCDSIQCRTIENPINTLNNSKVIPELPCRNIYKIDYIFVHIRKGNKVTVIDVLKEDGLDPNGESFSDHQPVAIKCAIRDKSTENKNSDRGNNVVNHDKHPEENIYKDNLKEIMQIVLFYSCNTANRATIVAIWLSLICFSSINLWIYVLEPSSTEMLLNITIHIIFQYIIILIVTMINDTEVKAIEYLFNNIKYELEHS